MKMLLLILFIVIVVMGVGFWLAWWMGWRSTEVVLVNEDDYVEPVYIDPVPGFIAGAVLGGAVGAIAAEEIIEANRPMSVSENIDIEEIEDDDDQ